MAENDEGNDDMDMDPLDDPMGNYAKESVGSDEINEESGEVDMPEHLSEE